jgi:hypothetical protein
MSEQVKASRALFENIVREAKHPKSSAAVERIRAACDYLDEHSIPISIPEVAQLCRTSGPKAQSIHNNRKFVHYINARKSEQKLQFHPPTSTTGGYRTDDVQANAMFYALETQISLKNSQNEALIRALRELGVYDIEAILQTGHLTLKTSQHVPLIDLRGLAARILNPLHLRKFGLLIQQDRIVAPDRNDRVFLEKAEVIVLQEIIKE